MSEQTPNSSEDLSGAEPSMEDILASIRKIISDDEPVAMESPEDAPTVSVVATQSADPLDGLMQGIPMNSNDLTSDAVLDVAAVQPDLSPAEADSVDLNIDDVLAGLDEDILEADVAHASLADVNPDVADTLEPELVNSEAQDDVLDALDVDTILAPSETLESEADIPQSDDDILALLDADIPLATEIDVPENIATSTDIEMDALLDDILMVPMDIDDEVQEAPIETPLSAETSSVEENSDLDLVKSLMADLADDQGEIESDEELDALLAIPEVEEDTQAETPEFESAEQDFAELETAEAEDDILGDILDMTLEDELQKHPEDNAVVQDESLESLDAVIDAEQDNIAENADIMVEADDDLPTLSEIAAAAEADAAAVETVTASHAVAATAGLGAAAGLAALGASALVETPDEAETAETHIEPTPESIPTQEISMPVQAVKADAILDDVTEAATAGAFAELNQVVEDKAIFNERGPRIGDLVQEALRPMLKEWLDANLKGIVERAVAKEVKRISSGK